MNLVFLGAAGSGKGTQAQKLQDDYGVVQISTGDLLRDAVKNGTELGRQADGFMKQGKLVPDALVIGLIEEFFREKNISGNILLDGFPRTLPQAEALDALLARLSIQLNRVLLLSVPEEILFERITGRRSCPKDGSVYHIKFAPPKVEGRCDKCGGELVLRSDDNPEKLKNRLAVFRTEIPQVQAHYEAMGLLRVVNGNQHPEKVYAELKGAL